MTRIFWRLLFYAATLRLLFHILLCWRCTHFFDGRVKLCLGGRDSWLDCTISQAKVEENS